MSHDWIQHHMYYNYVTCLWMTPVLYKHVVSYRHWLNEWHYLFLLCVLLFACFSLKKKAQSSGYQYSIHLIENESILCIILRICKLYKLSQIQHYYYVSGVIALSATGGIVLLVSIVVSSFVMLRYLLHYTIEIVSYVYCLW